MKKFSYIALSVLFGLSLSLGAQTNKHKTSLGESQELPGSDAKSSFIKNGDYLSESPLKDYNRFYGDSLSGFDEVAIKAELLGSNVYGKEYLGYIAHLKRAYINKKYGIGLRLPAANQRIATRPGRAVGGTGNTTAGRPVGGGGGIINVAPCVNEDFEATPTGAYSTGNAVSGWTISSRNIDSCFDQSPFVSGSPEFSVLATPVSNALPNGIIVQGAALGNSPLGGNNIIQMQDINPSALQTKISQTFPVTAANTLFQFAYAGIWQDGTHSCCQQPAITILMFNCVGDTLACSSLSLNAPGVSCTLNAAASYTNFQGYWWTDWQTRYIDLTPFLGSCVTIEVVDQDCIFGGHAGLTYFDAVCGGALVGTPIPGPGGHIGGPVSFCAGSNQAKINAPLGYSSYQWYEGNPPTPVTTFSLGGNTPVLTINNPVPGTVYTVQLVTASGCTYTALDTLKFSTVQIVGFNTFSTCPGGASGSATVVGNGSGTGYNYTWTGPNGSASVVGTASVATGLAAGIYSIVISGFGAAGCGSDTGTVTIGTGPPPITEVIKPYCGNEAYMAASGTNFQWYNGTTAIPASQGGTASSYTASSPYNGQIYWVTFTYQACHDSVDFLLVSTPPGNMYVSNIGYSCPGLANASATIQMNPAASSPGGLNSFSVYSTPAPPATAYSSSVYPTANNNYYPSNMPAGNYSVTSFDGSCKYNTTFTVTDYVYDYSVTPVTSTLCPNNNILASVSFSVPITNTQYSFQWSPATWVTGGAPNLSNISIQIAPVVPTGSIVTQVYSVTVVPSAVYCPITKTISVIAANPAAPIIAPIPSFCTNAVTQTINVTPSSGCTFATNSGNWLGTFNGQITPALITTMGANEFTVTQTVYTCTVSSIGSFNVAQFNTAALNGSLPNQCTTFGCTDLMSLVQSTVNGIWSGIGVGSNTFCPSGTPSGAHILTYNTTSSPYAGLCPDTRTISVQVDAPITPTITAPKPFCTNKPSFNMTVTPSGGTWSSGVPSLITPGGVVNPGYAPLGITTLFYNYTNGACSSQGSTVLDATQFHSAALTSPLGTLCINNGPVNLMGIVQSQVTGAWSGTNVVNNVFTPSLTTGVLATGNYTLHYYTYSTPNPNVCPDSSSVVVSILNPASPTISAVSLPAHCNVDGTFQVVASPNTGAYVVTPYLTVDGIFTPSLAIPGNNAVQYVIGVSNCNVSDTKQESIEAFVAATITGSIANQCNTNASINLAGLVVNSGGYWTGSPGILGNSFNPTNSGTGIIDLVYNTGSVPSGLCPDHDTLAVTVYSLATPAISQVAPMCNSHAGVQLQVTPLGGYFNGENTQAVSSVGWFTPSSAAIGDNIVSYTVTSGPCLAYTKSVIHVEAFVSANFAKYPGPYCQSDAPVDLNSLVLHPGGIFGGEAFIQGSIFTPSQANIGNGNTVNYQTNSVPLGLCPDISTVQIQVNPAPTVSVASSSKKGCVPVEINFYNKTTGTGRGEWNLGDGSDPASGLSTSHTYTSAGTYTVQFNYWDELGCSTQTMLASPIQVFELPKAAFTYGPYNEITISDPVVQFSNLSTVLAKNTYIWQIDDLYEVTDVNPSIKFPKIGQYEITLTATSVEGCKNKTSQSLEVKNDFGIYIPNSFTPNDDGLNDIFTPVFTPYGLDAKTFDMEIFDRWGISLYHTRDVSKGWNGSMQNRSGDKMKEDVYVYKIKYKDVEGVIYDKLGYITLIR